MITDAVKWPQKFKSDKKIIKRSKSQKRRKPKKHESPNMLRQVCKIDPKPNDINIRNIIDHFQLLPRQIDQIDDHLLDFDIAHWNEHKINLDFDSTCTGLISIESMSRLAATKFGFDRANWICSLESYNVYFKF